MGQARRNELGVGLLLVLIGGPLVGLAMGAIVGGAVESFSTTEEYLELTVPGFALAGTGIGVAVGLGIWVAWLWRVHAPGALPATLGSIGGAPLGFIGGFLDDPGDCGLGCWSTRIYAATGALLAGIVCAFVAVLAARLGRRFAKPSSITEAEGADRG